MLSGFNPPKFDRFYELVDHSVSIGRPVLIYGARGSGKTTLIDTLRPLWRTATKFEEGETLLFIPPVIEKATGVLGYLYKTLAGERFSSNRPSEICDAVEQKLADSAVKLLLIDNAQDVDLKFFRLLWRALENVRRTHRPIGCVVSYGTSRQYFSGGELFEDNLGLSLGFPDFGSFTITPSGPGEILAMFAHWVPNQGKDFLERAQKNEQDALEALDLMHSKTHGLIRGLADIAYIWNARHASEPMSLALAKSFLRLKGLVP